MAKLSLCVGLPAVLILQYDQSVFSALTASYFMQSLIQSCLRVQPEERIPLDQISSHPWLLDNSAPATTRDYVCSFSLYPGELQTNLCKVFTITEKELSHLRHHAIQELTHSK